MFKKIFKIIYGIITIIGTISLFLYIDDNDFVDMVIDYYKKEHSVIISNHYVTNADNKFVKITDDFSPKSRQDLLNIFYTLLASNNNDFTFYCNSKYKECITDVRNILDDGSLLSHINDFVSPFNTYKNIKINYTSSGKINVKISRIYNDVKINDINKKIDEIYPTLVSKTNSTTQNIKNIHDYIINHTFYDSAYISSDKTGDSGNAYGVLYNGKGICIGYTDLMKIFLDRMSILNYRVSNDTHVWNIVYLDGKWLHLDLTWDDPVSNDGKNYLRGDYFLITTEKLKEADLINKADGHTFNSNIYPY